MQRINAIQNHVDNKAHVAAKDTLTIIDNRTGKTYEIPIKDHTINASDLKDIKTPNGPILRSFDPGYMNTSCCVSRISFIDGDQGILRYRGYPIEQLAENSSFEEVAFLLLYGELPSPKQIEGMRQAMLCKAHVHEDIARIIKSFRHDAHPMGIFTAVMASLGTLYPDGNPVLQGQGLYKDKTVRNHHALRILGLAPTIAAMIQRHRAGQQFNGPNEKLGWTENFLCMLDKFTYTEPTYKPHPKLVRALDILFILHAEHELNCSTAATRHLASSAVDVYTCMAGATGALYGPRHGGANEAVVRMLEKIGKKENIPDFIDKVKNKGGEMLMGFGHRVYKNYDPRAKIVRRIAEDVFNILGREPLIEVAMELERIALSDEYFVKRKLYPNVDFYSGLIYRAMGFPTDYYPILFVVPRVAGWLAHWYEFQDDPDNKIVRPFQIYKGYDRRDYVPQDKRTKFLDDKTLAVPPNAAANRRNAGSK